MNRLGWIDSLKGIGIIFVIFAHLSPNLLIETHIYSFHMFLFFFLSGFLYKEKQGESIAIFVKKRMKRLLLPFLFWNTLAILVEYGISPDYNLKKMLIDFFFLDGKVSWNAPVWFLFVLFEVEVFFKIIQKLNSDRIKNLLLVLLFILGIFTQETLLPFGLSIFPIATSFYFLGNLIKNNRISERLHNLNNIQLIPIMVVLLITNVFFSVFFNIRISVLNSEYGNYLFTYIAGISGIFLYMCISFFLEEVELLKLFGRNSLLLLSTQYFMFRAFDVLSQYSLGLSVWHGRSTVKAFIVTVVTLTIYYLIIKVFSKSKNVLLLKINKMIGAVV